MKFTGYAAGLVILAGIAGFGIRARGEHSGAEGSPAVQQGGSVGGIVEEPQPSETVQQEDGRRQEAPQADALQQDALQEPVRRSYRGRGRNRYPGPIPTPAEWEPPAGPVRIGLQAGHWKAGEAPSELAGIRDNGTRWGGKLEWEANLAIAEETGALLKELGYEVDILPAVVPPGYRAHLFISIHADGSTDPRMSGFRVAEPRRDATGRASRFAALLRESYGEETGLTRLPTVTHRMQNYYAFNFRRYEHALHPMTIGVIIETGFLTSSGDRHVILEDPDRAARGIVAAVKAFPETPPPGPAHGDSARQVISRSTSWSPGRIPR